jgi:hypothetical protein
MQTFSMERDSDRCGPAITENRRERRPEMKVHRVPGTVGLAILLLILAFQPPGRSAYGQDSGSNELEISVTPYLWLAGIDGDLKVKGNEVDVDVDFCDDVWDALDFAGMVHIEATDGIWGVFVDPMYLSLSTDEDLGVADADIDIDMWTVEFGGFYRIAEWDTGGRPSRLDVLGGGRYWYLESQVDIGPVSRKQKHDWVDPFVGLRWVGQMNDWLMLHARGDVGGFAVNEDASELTWNVYVGPGFILSENTTLLAGYRWLNIDREKGSDTETDLTFSGPMVGLYIRF